MFFRPPILPLVIILAGCGAAEETAILPLPPVKEQVKGDTTRVVLQSRTDTVAIRTSTGPGSAQTGDQLPKIRFMVQIGAFKDPHLATAVQTLARDRYHLPVLNDYNIQVGLYQIRLGFFETRGSALEFRKRMAQEYPADYTDAWVVQLTR